MELYAFIAGACVGYLVNRWVMIKENMALMDVVRGLRRKLDGGF